MIQIDLDINILTEKIENTFEVIPPELGDPILREIEKARDATQQMNTDVQYARYLAHVYGRMRCMRLRKVSRAEAFLEHKIHIQGQLGAYRDIKLEFRNVGGLIQ